MPHRDLGKRTCPSRGNGPNELTNGYFRRVVLSFGSNIRLESTTIRVEPAMHASTRRSGPSWGARSLRFLKGVLKDFVVGELKKLVMALGGLLLFRH